MSNVAVLRSEKTSTAPARDYLGPGEVTEVLPHEIEARLPSGAAVRARIALAFPYEPAKGDEVLLIGNADGHYVIGVLHGRGRTALSFQGDVDLRAEGGTLRLSSDKAVSVEAPEVSVLADKIQQIAGAVAQRFTSLRQSITELLSVRAGQSHSIVDGASFSQSKSATILTEGKVTINGKQIHLG
ncbi:MAG: DUF3540 domain-containing protein [Minicystis sp.]